MTRRQLAAAVVAVAAVACGVFASSARAWYTSNLTILSVYEDSFRNYDFESTTVSAYNVDWPVNFVFFNNAEVDKVKYGTGWTAWGSTMYGRLNDGYGWVWDGDRGGKGSWDCYGSSVNHFRTYADADDRLYNAAWGYWTFATTHRDYNECGGGDKYSGNSEYAESLLANRAREVWGWFNVWEDIHWYHNYEPSRFVGSHWWWNNGYTSYAEVP